MLDTVAVPEQFEPIFQKAQEYVSTYFSQKKEDASTGTIEVFGQRYILVRAASMSVDFFDTIKGMFKDWGEEKASEMARSLLFDVAHAIGKMDARNFHQRMGLQDPIEKLSAGPIHFSHTGWAFVDISAESKPTADENYYLIYDHPFSFEADAWEKSGKKNISCVCTMNAGYSSGWCEESFGIPLVASEIMCKARGDSACRFIMAHPSRIAQYLQAYLRSHPEISDNAMLYRAGGFFQEFKQAQEALQKSEERYKNLFKANIDGILIADVTTKKFRYANPAICRMLGYSEEELTRMGVADIHPKESLEQVVAEFEALASGAKITANDLPCVRKDGQVISVSINAGKVMIDQTKYLLAIFRDITERKKAEKAIENLNKDLKSTVALLTQSNRQLNEFAYLAAHDLKTPLRGISTLAQWLVDDYEEKFDDKGRQQINLLVKRVERMNELINAILRYSTITRNRHNEHPVDLNTLVETILVEVRPPPNIKITINKNLPVVICDQTHLQQVFYHLLANAIRFMDKSEGNIAIDYADKDDVWEFSISDNGPGIAPQHFERIFRLFQTLAPHDESESTGIGLTVTKKIVELYNGKIWVESEPGQGSTFFFTLPKQEIGVKDAKLEAGVVG
jgi:PAS domain S-box-containing protein